MSSRDGTLITSKQRSTHLQAYDEHLPLIIYDLDIINIQIILTYVTHMACIYSISEHALLKIRANYQKQSSIIKLMFLAFPDIDLHHIYISKGFIYRGYFLMSAIKHQLFPHNLNTPSCFAITLNLKCAKWTICVHVMTLTCVLIYHSLMFKLV